MQQRTIRMVTTIVVTLALIFGLAACSSNSQTKSEDAQTPANQTGGDAKQDAIELVLWTFYPPESVEYKFWDSMTEKYSVVNDRVSIKVEFVPATDYLGTKLTAAFASGTGPDLFFVAPPTILKYVDSGVAMELSDYFTEDLQADFSEAALADVTVDGKIYAIPFEQEFGALFYDVEALEEAGIAPPTTWDELKEAAVKLTTDDRYGLTWEMDALPFQSLQWSGFFWQTGGDYLTPDKKHSGLDHKGAGEALQLWKDLIQSGAVNLKPSRSSSDIGMLAEGETAMQIATAKSVITLENEYPDKKVGVVHYPIPEGGQIVTPAGGWKIVANRQGKHPEEAAKFMTWAFAENLDIPLEWATKVKFTYPSRKSVFEAGQDVYHQEGLKREFTEKLWGTEKGELRANQEIGEIIIDMIQEALYNDKVTGAEVAAKAHEKLEKYLSTYTGNL